MTEAVIVAIARSPIRKAYRGAFSDTQGQALGGHDIAEAVHRAGVDAAEGEDVVMGSALQQGPTGYNVARQAVPRAGLPDTTPAMSLHRQCGPALIGTAAEARNRERRTWPGRGGRLGGGLAGADDRGPSRINAGSSLR